MPLDPTYQTYRAELWELNELNYVRVEARLEQRLAELRSELRQEIAQLRMETSTEFHGVCTEIQQVRTEIQQVRSELLRWMFGFWATTLLALAGMMATLR
jgi:hypothetical protein